MERRIATARCENETRSSLAHKSVKLEAGNSSTQIETGAHLRAAVTAKRERTIYLILRDLFKIQMDKSHLVK